MVSWSAEGHDARMRSSAAAARADINQLGGFWRKISVVPVEELFLGCHFDAEIVVLCVRWYLSVKLIRIRSERLAGQQAAPRSGESRRVIPHRNRSIPLPYAGLPEAGYWGSTERKTGLKNSAV